MMKDMLKAMCRELFPVLNFGNMVKLNFRSTLIDVHRGRKSDHGSPQIVFFFTQPFLIEVKSFYCC